MICNGRGLAYKSRFRTMPRLPAVFALPLFLLACAKPLTENVQPAGAAPPHVVRLTPVVESQPVSDDPDDPAIWIHPQDPALSLIIGTNKVEKPAGALVVFDLQGNTLQTIRELDRPNNVDVEQDVKLGDRTLDIAVTTERKAGAVRIYSIDAGSRRLSELASLKVFVGEQGDFAAPMGIALYKRGDGTVFVIVGRKSGPADGYLWQYRLNAGPTLTLVRKFGRFSSKGEIEAIAVDDVPGYVFYADEGAGIRKYHADPDSADTSRELAIFGKSGYRSDREGIAIYRTDDRAGYIISTDQIEGGSRYFLYRREGSATNPHDHGEIVAMLEAPADSTDGIEVTSTPLPSPFGRGIFVVMNSRPRNFLFFDWPAQLTSR